MPIKLGFHAVARVGGPENCGNEVAQGDIYARSKKTRGAEIIEITFTDKTDLQLFYLLIHDMVDREWLNDQSSIYLEQNGAQGSQLHIDGLEAGNLISFSREQLLTKRPVIALADNIT